MQALGLSWSGNCVRHRESLDIDFSIPMHLTEDSLDPARTGRHTHSTTLPFFFAHKLL